MQLDPVKEFISFIRHKMLVGLIFGCLVTNHLHCLFTVERVDSISYCASQLAKGVGDSGSTCNLHCGILRSI